MTCKQKNGLFIEKTELDAAGRTYFPDAKLIKIRDFDVLHSEHGGMEYHTVVSGEIWECDLKRKMALGNLCGEIISYYLKKHGLGASSRILFVGLGNPDIVPDSLGYAISKQVTPTSDIDGISTVYSFPVLVSEMTGFETSSLVRSLKELSRADAIICADSLTARTRERLQSVIQISDIGMRPGSAAHKSAGEISYDSMGVPVISIGVPMAIYEDKLSDYSATCELLTRAECDVICGAYATVIAHGLRSAFFGKYTDGT